jgi:hypothetical protein
MLSNAEVPGSAGDSWAQAERRRRTVVLQENGIKDPSSATGNARFYLD